MLKEGEDMYYNSDGFVVLTAAFLLARNYCCGNGCVNCPYNFKAVPEPRRSALIIQRQQQHDDEKNA